MRHRAALTTPIFEPKPQYLALKHSDNIVVRHRGALTTHVSETNLPALVRFESRRRVMAWLAESVPPPRSPLSNDPIGRGGADA